MVLLSHTYRSLYIVWWKGGVEIDGLGCCNCMLQDQRHNARTRTGANSIAWWKGGVEIDGLGCCNCMLQDQRHIARTRTGANSIAWWKGGVEKNGVLFAHVPEPNEFFL